jgi:hypothetical protein
MRTIWFIIYLSITIVNAAPNCTLTFPSPCCDYHVGEFPYIQIVAQFETDGVIMSANLGVSIGTERHKM